MSLTAEATPDGILVVTLDRPQARNAFDAEMASAMECAMDALETDDRLRVGVIRAEGPVFCAGQDLREAALGRLATAPRRGGFGLFTTRPSKPLVAAVQGPALAGGFELVLRCDLVVAARTASFGLAEVKLGLVAIGGGCFRLPRALPRAIAMEMLLTGQPLDAKRLYELGLVNRVTDPEGVTAEALSLARSIASNGPLAVRATAGIARGVLEHGWSEAEAWTAQAEIVEPVMRSADLKEGLTAFAEKRAPRFTGH